MTDGLILELMISDLSGVCSSNRKVSAFRILLEKHKNTKWNTTSHTKDWQFPTAIHTEIINCPEIAHVTSLSSTNTVQVI